MEINPATKQASEMPYTSTIMVNLAEDAEIRLIAALTETDSDLQESCTQLVAQPDQLLKALTSSTIAMNALMTDLDAEEAMAALSILAVIVGKTDESLGLLQDLATTIANTGTDADRKIAFISILFNTAKSTSAKCFLFTTLLDFAAASVASSLSSAPTSPPSQTYFGKDEILGRIIYAADDTSDPLVVRIIQDWTTKQRCQVYDAVCRALNSSSFTIDDHAERTICRQRYLLKYIAEDPTNTSIAKQVAIGAIRDPISLFQLQRNLLTTVQPVLSKTEPILYELLKIVQHGNLSDYQAFVKKHGSALNSDWALDTTKCEANMRMLTVCSLANQYEADIPYKVLADAVQQDVSEVESTVIQAIRTGLLQAKMDQLNQTVMVERSIVRQFDMEQWKKLQGRLTMWKTNVGGIMETLKQQRQATEAAAGQ